MGPHSHRSVRVVPGPAHEHPSSPKPPSRSATHAYAALMKRGRHPRERAPAGADSGPLDDDALAFAAYQSALSGIDAGRERDARGEDAQGDANPDPNGDFDVEQRELLTHLPRIARTLGIAGVEARPESAFAGNLASRIAQFCGEPSVTSAGVWEASIPLVSDTVADTVLHLSLSPYRLLLRFETSNPRSLQLLSIHSNALREQLAALLGPEREIEIV
jgi:type III secretion control protein HpaP